MSIYHRSPEDYTYTDPREYMTGKALPPGKDKDDQEYSRNVSFQKGYHELLDIVAGLQKDVTRINQCLTLPGAQEYIKNKDNWSAMEQDITGPNGKPDGIKEVLVFDSKGNLKVVNGYTLTQSTYPYRKYYRTKYPTAADRKHKPFGEFVDKIKEIGWDPNTQTYNYKYKINIPEFQGLQPEPSARAIFKSEIFQPQYEMYKLKMKQKGLDPMLMARVYNKCLSEAYGYFITGQVIGWHFQYLFRVNKEPTEKQVRKFKATDEFKKLCLEWVTRILSSRLDWSTVSLQVNWIIKWHVQQAPQGLGKDEYAPPPPDNHESRTRPQQQHPDVLNEFQERVNNEFTQARIQPPVVNQPPIVTEAQRQSSYFGEGDAENSIVPPGANDEDSDA